MVDIMENILDKTILELAHEKKLGVRVTNCLYSLKYSNNVTLRDVVRMSKSNLMKIRNFGESSLLELSEYLKNNGLWIGMTDEEINDYDERMGELIREADLNKINWDRVLCEAAISIAPHMIGIGIAIQDFKECAFDCVSYAKQLVARLREEIMKKEEGNHA